MLRLGIASDLPLLCADALCRAITLLAVRLGTIDFCQHRIINIIAERIIDRVQIRPMAVTR